MKRLSGFVLIGWACLAVGCDWMPGRPLEADRPLRPEEVTSFDVLWGTNCAGCHGADGQMGPARSLNDSVYLAWVDDMNMRIAIQQGIFGTLMPAFATGHGGTLTDAQIDLLIKGMRSRWGRPVEIDASAMPAYAANLGDATRGAAVYAEFCAGCHGVDGTGGSTPGSIVDPSYLDLVSDQSLRSTVVAGRRDLGMPDFRNVKAGQPMTSNQIADIVAWLVGHRVEFPGQPYARKETNNG